MLSGSLEPFALIDVLHLVSASKVSGRLQVTRPGLTGVFLLRSGNVVGVAPEGAEPADESGSIGLALELLDATGGEFMLQPGASGTGPIHLEVDELLERVAKRRTEWDEVARALGSLDATLRLAAEAGSETVTVSAGEWRLLALLATDARSAREVAREVARSRGGDDLEIAGTLASLTQRGLLEKVEPTLAAAAAKAMAAPQRGPGPQPAPAKEPAMPRDAPAKAPAAAEVAPAAAAPAKHEGAPATDAGEPDTDPARLLRELMQDESPQPPARRPLRIPTREEQRMRLRR